MMQSDCNGPLHLVADPYPPYQYATRGRVIGRDQEFIAAAFEAVGLRTTTSLLAWSHCLEAMRDGVADAIFQITPTPEREVWLAFSRPFRSARTRLYQRSGWVVEEIREDELSALARKLRMGVLEGFSYGSVIDEVPSTLRAPSDAALLTALRTRAIDLAVIDEGVAEYLLGDERDILSVPGFCVTRPLHLACRHDSREIVVAFDAGVDAISDE